MARVWTTFLAWLTTSPSAQALRQALPGYADAGCSECDFTVDMRCQGMRSGRHAPFHRVVECLLPMYGLVEQARASSGKVCALSWLNPHELNLEPFLTSLMRISWHKIIDENEACAQTVKYHAAERTRFLGANNWYRETFGRDPNMVGSSPIDMKKNLELLQSDANKMVPKPSRQIVIINRLHSNRRFSEESVEDLSKILREKTSLPIQMYLGQESVPDTIRAFNQAAGIVGYHGAAWANGVFASHHHCNEQLSTFMDLQDTTHWRINKAMMMNPWGMWHFYYIPLRLMLDANQVSESVFESAPDKDHLIKDLDLVPLRNEDIENVTSSLAECLKQQDW